MLCVFYELKIVSLKLSEFRTYLQQARLKEQRDAEHAANFNTNTNSHLLATQASSMVHDSALPSQSRTPAPAAPIPTLTTLEQPNDVQ